MNKNLKLILIIIVLTILIIIPPLLRHFVPKSSTEENALKKKVNTTLICSKDTSDYYKVVFKTTYKDSKIKKIVIKFNDLASNRGAGGYASTNRQMEYFLSLRSSTYEYINNDLIVYLTDNITEEEKEEDTIKSMYKDYDSAKMYYEKLGYNCK